MHIIYSPFQTFIQQCGRRPVLYYCQLILHKICRMTFLDCSIVQSDLTNFLLSNCYSIHSTAVLEEHCPLLKANLTRTPSFPLVDFFHKNLQNICYIYDHSTCHSLSYKFPSPRALLSLWNQSVQLLSLNMAPLSLILQSTAESANAHHNLRN